MSRLRRIGFALALVGLGLWTGFNLSQSGSSQSAQGPTVTIFRADGQVISGPLVQVTGTGLVIGGQPEVKFTDILLIGRDISISSPGHFFGSQRSWPTMTVENKDEGVKEVYSNPAPVFMNLEATVISDGCPKVSYSSNYPRISIELRGSEVAYGLLGTGESFSFTGMATRVRQYCSHWYPTYYGGPFSITYDITTYGQ